MIEVIRDSVQRRGYPPSMREIGRAVGLSSTSSVAHQLIGAGAQGLPAPRSAPAAGVRGPGLRPVLGTAHGHGGQAGRVVRAARRPYRRRSPILAEESVEDVPSRQLVGDGELFVLKVVGDSMIEAAICDGDWVTVRRQPVAENGDIVAAMLDGEATVKRFKREDGHV